MQLLSFSILFYAISASTENIPVDGFCEKSNEFCGIGSSVEDNRKFIFYDVNPPEGFNLRRDVYMRFAIMLAEAHKSGKRLNYHLVLPPWYNLYHWHEKQNPVPWGKFFDVKSLKSFTKVVELYELFGDENLVIDRVYALQNYENAFENGDFRDKWEINEKGSCSYTTFWGYSNITAKKYECIRFQGQASKLWEIISLHPNDKLIMFTNGEIALHDYYGTKQFWDCRKSIKFNSLLVKTAKKYIENNFECIEIKCDYISVHWRRRDFVINRHKDVPSIKGTVTQIKKAIKKHNPTIKKVFIATDAEKEEKVKLKTALMTEGLKVYFYEPSEKEKTNFQDGGIAIIDQLICSYASYFIGTHESTFSFRIQEEREILGFDKKTTFNRLCPDSGLCEKPSIWGIIN